MNETIIKLSPEAIRYLAQSAGAAASMRLLWRKSVEDKKIICKCGKPGVEDICPLASDVWDEHETCYCCETCREICHDDI